MQLLPILVAGAALFAGCDAYVVRPVGVRTRGLRPSSSLRATLIPEKTTATRASPKPHATSVQDPETKLRSHVAPVLATTFLVGGALTTAAAPAAAVSLGSSFESLVGAGFVQAFSLIFVSELGDKTFFIAALLAAKFSRIVSFVGSVGACLPTHLSPSLLLRPLSL